MVGTAIPNANCILATLPVRLGGLSATDPSSNHPQAAVASFLTCAAPEAFLQLSRLDPDLLSALDNLSPLVPELATPPQALWSMGHLGMSLVTRHWSIRRRKRLAAVHFVASSIAKLRTALNRCATHVRAPVGAPW